VGAAGPPYQVDSEGVLLAVRLTPRAGRSGVDGVTVEPDGRAVLRLRIAAAPVEGAANEALIRWLSDQLRMRKSDVRLIAGDKARLKRLRLLGDGAEIAERIDTLIVS